MTIGRFKFVVWNKERTEDDMFTMFKEMYEKYNWSYYHVAQEIAPETGNKHMDGYYEYTTQRKEVTERKKFTKKFGNGFGDLVKAQGTAGENKDYSEKEGRRFETAGTPGKGQGERTDLNEIKDDIMSGKRKVDDIAVEDPEIFHQYGRTLSKIEDIALRKRFRTEMTTGIWYYGPTAVGKSHKAFEGYHPDTHYLWKLNEKSGWQDGYIGQETVIMNDFRGEIKYNELLQIIDKWPHTVPRRGREPAPFLAKKVIITSSLPPELVYKQRIEEDSLEQLYRRVKVVELQRQQKINFEVTAQKS